MRSQVMPVVFQIPNQSFESRIPVKATREKEGGFGLVFLQRSADDLASVCKLISGKDQRNLSGSRVAPDNRSVAVDYYFFACLPSCELYSLAASRYISEAVPSIVGSLVL